MKLGEAHVSGEPGRRRRGWRARQATPAGGDDKVVDVDFEEVKDDDSKKSA